MGLAKHAIEAAVALTLAGQLLRVFDDHPSPETTPVSIPRVGATPTPWELTLEAGYDLIGVEGVYRIAHPSNLKAVHEKGVSHPLAVRDRLDGEIVNDQRTIYTIVANPMNGISRDEFVRKRRAHLQKQEMRPTATPIPIGQGIDGVLLSAMAPRFDRYIFCAYALFTTGENSDQGRIWEIGLITDASQQAKESQRLNHILGSFTYNPPDLFATLRKSTRQQG